MQQLEESNIPVDVRLSRLIAATGDGCRRDELIADIEVIKSLAAPSFNPAGLAAGYLYGRNTTQAASQFLSPSRSMSDYGKYVAADIDDSDDVA